MRDLLLPLHFLRPFQRQVPSSFGYGWSFVSTGAPHAEVRARWTLIAYCPRLTVEFLCPPGQNARWKKVRRSFSISECSYRFSCFVSQWPMVLYLATEGGCCSCRGAKFVVRKDVLSLRIRTPPPGQGEKKSDCNYISYSCTTAGCTPLCNSDAAAVQCTGAIDFWPALVECLAENRFRKNLHYTRYAVACQELWCLFYFRLGVGAFAIRIGVVQF